MFALTHGYEKMSTKQLKKIHYAHKTLYCQKWSWRIALMAWSLYIHTNNETAF